MGSGQISIMDLLVETHIGLERQGPGSSEATVRALSFIDDLGEITRAADMGCGTGGQTMELARHVNGDIVGVDRSPDFIKVFNDHARKRQLGERVTGVVGSMDDLPFEPEAFDLIWSEGAIDNIGFEKGVSYWNGFLRKGGHLVVSCPAWFTEEHPAEVEKLWLDAGSRLDTVEHNIGVMEKSGYSFVAAFALPEKSWTEHYFAPREAAERAVLEKYDDHKTVKDFIESNKQEVALYSKYKQHYGYAFFIGKKQNNSNLESEQLK